MREEFEKLVAAGKIGRQHMDPLLRLATSGYCEHRAWGIGRITTVDTVFCRFVIDFHDKSGHHMDLTFAAQSLRPIPPEHIRARKIADINALRHIAAVNHLELIKMVLLSFGGKATVEDIQKVLVPDVIEEDWRKWWEVARAEMKKDGHFQLPLKKTAPIVYQAQETTLDERLMANFRAAKGLKARLVVANELQKSLADLSNKVATVEEVITALNADIGSHQRTQSALALEAIFLRDEIREGSGVTAPPGELDDLAIWSQVNRPAQVLEAIPAAKHKRALQSFKKAHPEDWTDSIIASLNSVSAKLCGECVDSLIHDGKLEALKVHLSRLVAQHQASAELLLWLGKERSDTYADILGPEVFRAMLTAMERDQFNEKRSNKLRDFILDDHQLLVELIGSADLEVIKDLTRALQLSPCFDDMDKRSLLARIVKSYPTVQSLISGDHKKEDTTYIVSWKSLERRKDEYAELVRKKIPANSKEIAIARSYGDLRENHEYKAAKEMQKLLMRRKLELETQLVRARGTDFATMAREDTVTLGTRVSVTDLNAGHPEHFIILGAWDSDPDKGIISYLTPVAQALLNKKAGEEVEFEAESIPMRYRVDRIEVYKMPEAPAAPPATPAA